MDLARRKPRVPSRARRQPTLVWTVSAGFGVALVYLGVAAATLADVSENGTVTHPLDAAWPHWVAGVAIATLAGALAQMLTLAGRPPQPTPADDQRLALEDQHRGSLAWVLPTTTTVASILLVRLYGSPLAAGIGALAVLTTTIATVVIHHHLRSERPTIRSLASIGLGVIIHAGAFFLLVVIYSFKYRGMYSATAIALATCLLLLQLTDGEGIAWLRRLLYGVVGGLLMGQATWALNYWAAAGPVGGASLLVVLYFISGLTLHAARGSLGRRIVFEYSAVCVVAFAVTAIAVTAYR